MTTTILALIYASLAAVAGYCVLRAPTVNGPAGEREDRSVKEYREAVRGQLLTWIRGGPPTRYLVELVWYTYYYQWRFAEGEFDQFICALGRLVEAGSPGWSWNLATAIVKEVRETMMAIERMELFGESRGHGSARIDTDEG